MQEKTKIQIRGLNRYIATVYHGGKLYGLGVYGTTRPSKYKIIAIREGKKLAKRCTRICGGSPTVEIVTI